MYESYVNFKDENQRRRVLKLFFFVLNTNKVMDFINSDYVKQYSFVRQYLNDEDTAVFFELIDKYLNIEEPELNKKNNDGFNKITQIKRREKQQSEFKLEWEEITPYKTLGIEEREYTKDQLLDIVAKRINFIKAHGINKEAMDKEIDEILDAYNQLTRESHKQK